MKCLMQWKVWLFMQLKINIKPNGTSCSNHPKNRDSNSHMRKVCNYKLSSQIHMNHEYIHNHDSNFLTCQLTGSGVKTK